MSKHKHKWQFVLHVINAFHVKYGYAKFICDCGEIKWVKVKE